jgi:hypothetical protein
MTWRQPGAIHELLSLRSCRGFDKEDAGWRLQDVISASSQSMFSCLQVLPAALSLWESTR